MTFKQFCIDHGVTEAERDQLLEFLVFVRFRGLMQWWENMKR